jgi:hypothetical protein
MGVIWGGSVPPDSGPAREGASARPERRWPLKSVLRALRCRVYAWAHS